MASLVLYNSGGEKAGEVEVKDEIFDVPVKEHLVHSAVVAFLSNQRRGQARTKNRHEVSGGGVKPWKQKGTGRARAGSNTSPIWRRGGVAHGPDGRNYSVSLPKKLLRKALCSALTAKRQEDEVVVVENLQFDSPRTKDAEKVLKSLKLSGKTLVVIDNPGENIRKSFRNLKQVRMQNPLSLNTYDVLNCEHLLLDRSSLEVLENRIIVGTGCDLSVKKN
jgi:large subunit ribosomal protein L4